MTSKEIATTVAGSTDLTLTADQRGFTSTQIAALAQLGLEDVPDGDLSVFFHQAKRTGLDPFAKQIYMIGRSGGEVEVEEVNPNTGNTRRVKRKVTKYTIQIGIDGYRLLTRRAADANGDTLGMEGPLWCDSDGVWRDVWPEEKIPVAAKFILFRNGEPFPFVAHYSEYVQTRYDRDAGAHVPNVMWTKMPRNQLAKCAEVGACRRAYPADFAGLVFTEAAVIDEDGNIIKEPEGERRAPARARGVSKLRDRAKAARADVDDNTQDAETVDEPEAAASAEPPNRCGAGSAPVDPEATEAEGQPASTAEVGAEPAPPPPGMAPPASPKRLQGEQQLDELLAEAKITGDDRPAVVSEILAKREGSYRLVDTFDALGLPDVELRYVLEVLRARKARGDLYDYCGEAINAASLRESGLAE
jgi:phage recombination protein Bet